MKPDLSAAQFWASKGVTEPQQALIALSYQVEYFPTTFFIDAKGKIFKKEIRNLDTEAIDSILADMDLG